jgi:hypothetical protein
MVVFESHRCVRCDTELGFDPGSRQIVTTPARRCANAVLANCNWVLAAHDPNSLCLSCRLTRTRPPDHDAESHGQFVQTETAKRRLVFDLLDLGLPVVPKADEPARGLAFDLLSSRFEPVTIGHDDGLITIDVAESNDAHRALVREQLDEPYRTMLGHLRHEVGHYYWSVLVYGTALHPRFREVFGDERADYTDATARHYASRPLQPFPAGHVSAYATMHPWEDWAETFAHYVHIRATLHTAAAYGVTVAGPAWADATVADALASTPRDDVTNEPFSAIVQQWLPLTYALNAINRSMGDSDLYPFVLTPAVIDKLAFVHAVVRSADARQ